MYIKKKVIRWKPVCEKLITSGPFSYTRNPIYFGTILSSIGFAVVFNSIYVFFIYTIPMSFYYFWLARYEERILMKEFGDEYIKYKKFVSLLIPSPKVIYIPKNKITPLAST